MNKIQESIQEINQENLIQNAFSVRQTKSTKIKI